MKKLTSPDSRNAGREEVDQTEGLFLTDKGEVSIVF
jgi:hypothetical protein